MFKTTLMVLAVFGLAWMFVLAWNHRPSYVDLTPDVVVIDGCQYFKLNSYSTARSYYTLTHKGNCTNH